ncbi:MAG: PAS domain S-box protein [Bacteroidales bacterium]
MQSKKNSHYRTKVKRILEQKGIQEPVIYNKILESIEEEFIIYQKELEQQKDKLQKVYNELETSRKKCSELFNEAPNGYIIIKNNYIISDVNTTGTEILGTHKKELIGKDFSAFINPDSQETFYLHLKNVIQQREQLTCELKLQVADKNTVFVKMESTPVKYPENQEDQNTIRSAFIDITQQKAHEQKLKESENKYRTIFENSGEGFFLISNKIEDCNDQAARLFGYKKNELIGKDPADDISPRTQPDGTLSKTTGKNHIKKALQGNIQHFYWKHKTKSGQLFDTEITLNAIETEAGKKLLVVVHDISEQIENQKELKEKNEEIRSQNEEYIALDEELNESNNQLIETIKELKDKKEKLQEANDIINKSPAVAFLWKNSEGWPVEFVTDNVIALLGYTPSDFYSGDIDYKDVIHPYDQEKIVSELIKYSNEKNRESFTQEYRIVSEDGKVKWVDDRTWIERDGSGNIIHFKGILLEITEKKRAEQRMKKSESKFKTLYNSASDAIYIYDLEGNMLEVNIAATERLGYSKKELLKLKPVDLNTPGQKNNYLEKLQELKTKNKAFFENEHVTKDGKIIPVELNSRIINYEGQKAVLTTSRDITERKKTEWELILQNRISNTFINSEREDFYKNVLDIIRKAFSSQYGYFGYINEEGDLVSESMTKDIWSECHVNSKSIVFPKSSWKGVWGESLKKKQTLYTNHNLKLPEGHVQLKSALAAPIILNDKLIGQIAIANKPEGYNDEDKALINKLCNYIAPLLHSKIQEERYKLNLLQAKEKAEESDRLKSVFLANMSHEIRTPMNAILGFAQLLKENQFSPDKQKEFLEIIYNRSKHLLQILNDIVDLSKIESNLLQTEYSPCNLNDLIHELYNSFSIVMKQTENKNITLKLHKALPQEKSFMYTDQDRLNQILTNLLNNALKFTDEGMVEFGYMVNEEGNFTFFVRDTGIGIPKAKQDEIFIRFRQGDESSSRKYEGTGLGLSISKHLIELLGGKIWVDSKFGQGSTFYFTLPQQQSPESEIKEEGASEEISYRNYNWNNHKILIVEDDQISLKYMQEILKETKVSIITANNGKKAFQLFKEHLNISLIIMDIQLPDENGTRVTQKIREHNKNIPVIAQTAYAMNKDKAQCLEAGCNDYITKPLDKKRFLAIVDKHLTKQEEY